ncbi:hypothetical protein GQ53DRAFT_750443 [Thozetella sp. PMI_491]|nr:hypothetical protein GQ53DRAFT_750443 [Thozetella sp. PMI_491]
MRSRPVPIRRALVRALPRPSSPRLFMQHAPARLPLRTRPQLPFLSVPTTTSRQRVRFLTTQRKAWLRYEITLGIKYAIYIGIGLAACTGLAVAFHQEALEREFPTPHEWSFLTRVRFRVAVSQRDLISPKGVIDWVAVIQHIKAAVDRLEDPKVDGQQVGPAQNGVGKDISAKPEAWRRGYFEALMIYAKAAEYVDGWVLDKKRGIVFPPDMVKSPDNPFPSPIPAGSASVPKLEDCETAFASPETIYQQILAVEGFTPRQVIDANLAYAAWLEYSHDTASARAALQRALAVAAADAPTAPFDPKTFILNESAGPPSANLLKALTEYATWQARIGDVDSALPILVSILKARRSLPPPGPKQVEHARANPLEDPFSKLWRLLKGLLAPPEYPPPPDDGSSPPIHDPEERCEEAALHLYIGEIMYAANASSREEGLAWTRDAVDLAEEQLHKIKSVKTEDRGGKKTCRECLRTGLGNWASMVEQLAREEAMKQEGRSGKSSGWFGLWRDSKAEDMSRWAAEGKVILERQRRLKELLEDIEPPKKGFASIFTA